MNILKPISRHEALRPLSHDHHYSLLLCWKIRTGLENQIAAERIKNYADWFYQNHLLPHFKKEEEILFPLLDSQNKMIKKALAAHRRLSRHFVDQKNICRSLSFIEEELEAHIRFEERVLFNEIQQKLTGEIAQRITPLLHDSETDNDWNDKFWDTR